MQNPYLNLEAKYKVHSFNPNKGKTHEFELK